MKAAIVGLIAVLSVGSQAKPDFNGAWVLNSTKSAKAISEGTSPAHGQMTVTVTEKSVTFHSDVPQANPLSQGLICAFGPSPAENTRPTRPLLCSAKWDGDNLVITTMPKPYPNIASTGADQPRAAIYSVSGAELTASATTPRLNGKEPPITSTVFWDKAK